MSIYRMTEEKDELVRFCETSFEREGVKEADLQQILRVQPDILEDGLFILSEEYGNWDESKRRIDLLALDENGHLVVVELKRSDSDRREMELQAVRYAALVGQHDARAGDLCSPAVS